MAIHTPRIGRREFLGATAATAVGFTIVKPQAVRGSEANSAVRFGILGVGGRGTEVGSGFITNAGARLTALADLFPDRIEQGRKHFDELQAKTGMSPLAQEQLFSGADAYKRIVESKEVDFIQISTPPYFHPAHLEAAVTAGRHVYCEKPIAIDVPGAKKAMALGKQAEGRLSLDVGFQIRLAPPMKALTERLWNGAIGRVACGAAFYYCNFIDRPAWPNASPAERHLRNWLYHRDLSGDIVVEQNIHVIDMCNWFLQAHPVLAEARCDRKVRTDEGDCKDNFAGFLVYPGNVQITFGSSQFGVPEFDAGVRLFGSDGSAESHYDARVSIAAKNKWDAGLAGTTAAGAPRGALDDADPEKQKAFVASIANRQFHNEAQQGAESALSAMLVRNAAYSGKPLSWDELLASTEVYDPKIDLTTISS
jgi:predicted dehydrogenase